MDYDNMFHGDGKFGLEAETWLYVFLKATITRTNDKKLQLFPCCFAPGSPASDWYDELPESVAWHLPLLLKEFCRRWLEPTSVTRESATPTAPRVNSPPPTSTPTYSLPTATPTTQYTDHGLARQQEEVLDELLEWATTEQKARREERAWRTDMIVCAMEAAWRAERWQARLKEERRVLMLKKLEEATAAREREAQRVDGLRAAYRAERAARRSQFHEEMARAMEAKRAARKAEAEARRREEVPRTTSVDDASQFPCTISTTSTTLPTSFPRTTSTTIFTTTSTVTSTIPMLPHDFVSSSHSPQTAVDDVFETTRRKPPDILRPTRVEEEGAPRENRANEDARSISDGDDWEREARGFNVDVSGLSGGTQPESFAIDDHRHEIVVLPPTKHPTTIPSTPSTTPHDDERPLATKHPTEPVVHASLDHEQACSPSTTDSRSVVLSPTTGDRPAPTKHPTALSAAASITISRTTLSGHDPTAPPFANDTTRSTRFVQPPPNDDRPAAVKHPATRENASLIVIPPAAPPFSHDESPKADGRPAPTKHPTMVPLTSSVTSHHSPPLVYDPPALTKHPGTGPTISITDSQPHDDERPPATKHPTNLAPRPRKPSSCRGVVRLLAWDGCPALTKHPTTRANASFVAIAPTVSPFVHVVTRLTRFVQPPPNDDRPQAVKHPTALPWTVLVINTRSPWLTGGLMATIALTGEHELAFDRPAPTKHPTTRKNASLTVIASTILPSVHGNIFSTDFVRPPAVSNPPAPTKHPTPRQSPTLSTHDSTRLSCLIRLPAITNGHALVSMVPSADDQPSPIKHPTTTRDTASSIVLSPTPLFTFEATRLVRCGRPSLVGERPARLERLAARFSSSITIFSTHFSVVSYIFSLVAFSVHI
ncbi:hypothetical protein BOTBODRAFT_178048 [Botryobasidium botryosum FD-172 SS1]|uniref:Uncharacterized protein n=1 Tax=Botryobasidium botryosum (strain FD-172 SS1) TaxID=930990 RepID=A0A067M4S2_BOTB1|nr:hypothetical protein BOTBODRAFT_178048 [Botryobasidium botryosum FD-172 SS1]